MTTASDRLIKLGSSAPKQNFYTSKIYFYPKTKNDIRKF